VLKSTFLRDLRRVKVNVFIETCEVLKSTFL